MSAQSNGDALRARVPTSNGTSSKTPIPTNSVTTKDGVVKVRIDPTLMVADVVKQLVANLQIIQPSSDFALRDDDDELVTNENLRRMIKAKAKLKYVTGCFKMTHPGLVLSSLAGSSIPRQWKHRKSMKNSSFARKRVFVWLSSLFNATFV
jgi:hypothetical protein